MDPNDTFVKDAPVRQQDTTSTDANDNSPLLVNPDNYQEEDVFLWANNLVQYVDELKINLYFFNKNLTVYKTKLAGEVAKQLRPLFIDELLEYVLGGIEEGLTVRAFEEAEKEDNVLQKTRVQNVEKLVEVFGWLKHQRNVIELFSEEDNDIKRMKGVVAECSHPEMKTFYVIKSVPTSQIMKGHTAWMLKDDVFRPFDKMSALKIPGENHLLAIGDDLFVFSQPKLKQLFGYDAKAASVARQKVAEIETNFKLSFAEGINMQTLVKGKPGLIKKLQNIEAGRIKQDELLSHAEEVGIELMEDESGAIIIMDEKDMTKFVNLLNDDYIESPMTGERYEIIRKRPLKPPKEDADISGI